MFTKNSFSLVENSMAESMYMRFFENTVLGNDEAWERRAYYAGFVIGEAVCSKLEAEIAEGRDPKSITYLDIINLRDEYYNTTPFANEAPTIYVANTVCAAFWKWGWIWYLTQAKDLEEHPGYEHDLSHVKVQYEKAAKYREIAENFAEKIADEWNEWV